MKPEFNVWHLDDGFLGGHVNSFLKPEIWRGAVSCTKPSRACLFYRSCCSPFSRLLVCHSLLVSRNEADTWLRIAVSLRQGAPMCAPHTCICGVQVDSPGVHGLACRKSAGCHMRHNAVNDFIKRALASANVQSVLEPISLSWGDGKRPEGWTVLPWLTVVAWSGISCVQTLWQPVTWNVRAICRRGGERGWLSESSEICRRYTASCQWRSSDSVRWARRRQISSSTQDTASRLWQQSRGHAVPDAAAECCYALCNAATPSVFREPPFRLQSNWTNCFIYSFKRLLLST